MSQSKGIMIRNSYIFLPKISKKKELHIWKQGINDWDAFLAKESIKGISEKSKLLYNNMIREAKKELHALNSGYFIGKLPCSEMWRLYDFFKEEAVFLDIETSGVGRDSYITIIGLFDGINTKTMVRNINLDFLGLRKELERYKIIITFNGASFDLPMLSKRDKGIKEILAKIPHIDLKTMAAKAGLKGGLKQIERELGIKRSNAIVESMYNGDPFQLWRMFLGSGDDYYLRLLIEYNEEDCINLKQIANKAYWRLRQDLSS
jgi:uncharacterized protein YprB with RNaseH-like and TPR domain